MGIFDTLGAGLGKWYSEALLHSKVSDSLHDVIALLQFGREGALVSSRTAFMKDSVPQCSL